MVRSEAWPTADLQEPKDEEQPLGGHGDAHLMPGDRAPEQKGWLLFQALPSPGTVHLGAARS